MQTGAVAMIDALGWKGIWQRPSIVTNPGVVLDKLKLIRAAAHEEVDDDFAFFDGLMDLNHQRPSLAFISDCIAIGVGIKEPFDHEFEREAALATCVQTLASNLGRILFRAGISEPALAYRGAIATGDFLMDDPFVLGDAIDRAATGMERAQAGHRLDDG